jgi:hemolysin activation/secretion protein
MGLRLHPSCAFAPLLGLLAGLSLPARADDAPAPPPATSTVVPVAGRAFDIREIQVDGNTVLESVDIEAVMEFFVGEGRSAADVDGARAALEKLYRELGYHTVSVTIPRQTIQDGIVMLQVNETTVARTVVEGGDYTSIAQVKKEVPSLAPGTVPRMQDVQEDMVYANRLATRRVTPELGPGREPGTLDVKLKVEDDLPVGGSLGWNNEHARGTSPARMSAGVSYDNLFQLGHSLNLLYMTAPQRTDDGTTWSLSYNAPLPEPTWNLGLSLLKTDSEIPLGASADALTDNLTVGFSASKRLGSRIENWYPTLSFGADFKNYKSSTVIRSPQGSLKLETPLDYLPFNLTFLGSYYGDRHRVDGNIAAVFTVAAIGSDETELEQARFGADGQSLYLRGSLQDRIRLPKGFSLVAKLTGQITGQALLPAEKLSMGGADSVRGYFESEISADRGIAGSLELRLPSLPEIYADRKWAAWLTELQPYLFLDGARLTDHSPFIDADTPRGFTLASAGAGLSARLREYASLDLVWSQVLHDVPFAESTDPNAPSGLGTPTESGDNRLLFRFLGSF